ncbi:uncharacterized protein J3R85_016379 [Psidium guajava]|nr:uncharacterized protein J3R85_016379 [Psidium guajava]
MRDSNFAATPSRNLEEKRSGKKKKPQRQTNRLNLPDGSRYSEGNRKEGTERRAAHHGEEAILNLLKSRFRRKRREGCAVNDSKLRRGYKEVKIFAMAAVQTRTVLIDSAVPSCD